MSAVKGSKKSSFPAVKATPGVRCMGAEVPPAWPGRAVAEEVKIRNGPKPISLIGSTGSIGTQVGYVRLAKNSFYPTEFSIRG